ncbi:MAG: hypothetical protein ACRDXC_02480 [Acidimicrobiales bacterium]
MLTLREWFDRDDPLKKCYGSAIVGQTIWSIRARPAQFGEKWIGQG